MAVLENQREWALGCQCGQNVADLAKHTVACDVDCAGLLLRLDFTKGGELCEPRRRLCSQRAHNSIGIRAADQLSESLEHWVIRLLDAVTLDALTARDAKIRPFATRALDEYVDQCSLADARFAGNEDDLFVLASRFVQAVP